MNHDKPSVALRLADELDKTLDFQTRAWSAAKELRRISAINQAMLDALLNALPYVEDVAADKAQLACFKPDVVRAHVREIRAAIAKATEAA